ncbi:unnamed protein product [Brassica rapa]|uniref:Uncharacterized protein n=1 Tax=Brassica campestris TaxID=3711 RepID=A0A8D9HKL6_BRACM|nr:unnamed protein product [Brassica rapa]
MQSSLVLFFSLTLRHLGTHRKSNSSQKDRKRRMEVMSLAAPFSQRKFTGCFLSAPISPRRTIVVQRVQGGGKKKLLRTLFDSFRLGRESRQSEEDH